MLASDTRSRTLPVSDQTEAAGAPRLILGLERRPGHARWRVRHLREAGTSFRHPVVVC